MNRNIRDQLKLIKDKPRREEAMADICKLQVCKTVEIFELGVELFWLNGVHAKTMAWRISLQIIINVIYELHIMLTKE